MRTGDVVWTKVNDLNGSQWIRVVVDYVYQPDDKVVVRPLFPGDARLPVWAARREDLLSEEPSFDEIDATYDDGGEFAPA